MNNWWIEKPHKRRKVKQPWMVFQGLSGLYRFPYSVVGLHLVSESPVEWELGEPVPYPVPGTDIVAVGEITDWVDGDPDICIHFKRPLRQSLVPH